MHWFLDDDATMWWDSVDLDQLKTLSDELFEQVFLDKWFHAKKKDIKSHKDLLSCGNILLQVQGYIQKEKVIISINPS